jgi:hypothetical protein
MVRSIWLKKNKNEQMKRFSSNITDEELYCLFREAAEQYNPKLNDSEKLGAWESIANSLLAGPGRHRTASHKWKKRCLALLMVWLLTGGLAIFRIIQLQESNKQYAREATQAKQVLYPSDNTVLMLSTVPDTPKRKTNLKKTAAEPTGRLREKFSMTAVERVPVLADREGFEPPEAFTATVLDVKKKKAPDNCFNNNNAAPGIHPDSANRPDQQIAAADTVATPPEQPQEKPSKQKKKKRSTQQWQIGLATGLEWNRVKSSSNGKTGQSYGLTIQYRFAPRWSVETGILVVSKLYTSKEWNYGTISVLNELKLVKGECRTIDVPLNIRYDILRHQKGRLFGSAGISSFFMQKEDYQFIFDQVGRRTESSKKVYNKNHHLFSIVNVSAGYERSWNRVSLQAAPYLKLPLKAIGEGKIDLVGAGLLFSLKYNY